VREVHLIILKISRSNQRLIVKKIVHKINKSVKRKVRHLLKKDVSDFATTRKALDQWLFQLKNVPEPKGKVLITALRNYTWIEWAAYCAAVIRQMGFETVLFYKGSEVRLFYTEKPDFNFWEGVKKIPGIKLVDLEELPYQDYQYNRYYQLCQKDAVAALAYDLHLESADIIDNSDKYAEKLNVLRKESALNGARVYQFCSENKFHEFICYSGLIRDTSMILRGALDSGQDTVCVEGWGWRQGHMIYNFNGPSLEYNINGWMNYFGKWDEKKNKEMAGYFSFLNGEEQNEEWLKSFYNVQQAKVSEELPKHIAEFIKGGQKIFLLACNVIGDSSLLNRETIFKSHRDFILQVVKFFTNRPDLKLIIRAHPGEDWVKSKVVIKMGDYANSIVKGQKNILVINDSEKVNTFSLLPYTSAGLVWITSAGVDMVVRGVPVIAAAKPKYSGMGIVEEPKSPEEFFSLIDEFSSKDVRPTLEQIQKAKEYLYLVFKGFSFEAQGRNFRASTCKLNNMPLQEEHDRFYRILLRLEKAPDLINTMSFNNND